MNTQVYLIKPFTNMHVGSGKENAGIVDNTVQRDVLTNFPVINSTSLKGALREYAEKQMKCQETDIKYVFGKGNEKNNGMENDKGKNFPGMYNFFSAHLLTIPARSNKLAFLNATCPQIVEFFLRQTKLIGKTIDEKTREAFKQLLSVKFDDGKKAICFEKELHGSVVEFYDIKARESATPISDSNMVILKKWLGSHFVFVENKVFEKQIAGKLPIIARNNLDNGQSTNLWYEEIIPRETVFYTFISAPDTDWRIEFDKSVLQIGANASVGYGYSEMYKPQNSKEN